MSLAPGLLLAAPPLGDPHFDRSVVLLAAHGPEGAFGWVINGRAVMPLAELLQRAEVSAELLDVGGVLRIGGPVAPEQVWLVYRAEQRFEGVDGQWDIGAGILACASRRILEVVATERESRGMVALAGYAGWAPEQLEREIQGGAWLPTDVEADVVFDVPQEELWHHAYARAGTTPMAFTTRTVGSA